MYLRERPRLYLSVGAMLGVLMPVLMEYTHLSRKGL